ncbi:hypothetical protein POK33_37820 [Burkholderia cenocepacia]|uniref:hypothetical protein n=1 Tax=Burkholderia cenocepacia TaxID=95486 RepID=UPI0023BA1B74|nr:hypothetical protein [Burkholderia cenocepacia]MDF0506515.1 hypothetical protein [Burkholderia cenocepacia]
MGTRTERITYNVGDRGREHIGTDRHFDLRALARLVNSPAMQEKVKNRDLVGYYGHSIRMKFGINPPEWIVVDGRQINLEPALVTTYLSADENGNIEHEAEFLDTAPGKIAARLHSSRTGGFSSAIDAASRGGFHVPTKFGGFDYVLEPNYTTNRGYVFDSASTSGGDVVFDSVVSEWNQQNAAMNLIFDSMQADYDRALEVIERFREENEALLSMLSNTSGNRDLVLDGVDLSGRRPLVAGQGTAAFARRAAAFDGAPLAAFDRPDSDEQDAASDGALNFARKHYGVAS